MPLLSLFLLVLAPATAAGAVPPEASPFDLLQRVREAYLVLDAYRDLAELTIERGGGAAAERWAVELDWRRGEALALALRPIETPPGGAAISWRCEAGAGPSSLPGEIEALLGPGARDALAVAALLAGGSAALPDPDALALEDDQPCGGAVCLALVGTRPEGAPPFRLLLDPATLRIRETEVRIERAGEGAPARLRLVHRPAAIEVAVDRAPGEPEATFSDRIDVALGSVVVRVLDRWSGESVRGLGADDFRLSAGGAPLSLVAVEWVSSSEPLLAPEELAELAAAGIAPPPSGKLVVFFVQADLKPSRAIGQLRTIPEAKRFLDTLGPDDRVAVLSFDSHLKLRQDFTLDRERVRAALDQAVLVGPAPAARPRGELSLARHLDFAAASDAAVPEAGLAVAGRALARLPGEKLLVFVGWGLGRLGQAGVEMIPEYRDALDALAAARATVFALDVTDADYHSLEVGLKQIARDTGGQYIKTMYHPRAALARLADLAAGYYRIRYTMPEGTAGGRLRVELRDSRLGEVVAPRLALGENPASGGG